MCLQILIEGLVDNPDAVSIDVVETDHMAHFEITVDPPDFGKVLGKKGAYARSMRRLWGAAFAKLGKSFNLHIIDPRRDHSRRG